MKGSFHGLKTHQHKRSSVRAVAPGVVTLPRVATACAAANVIVPKQPCVAAQLQACAVKGVDMTAKCTAAAASPTDLAAGLACCQSAAPFGAANCSCMLPDDASNTDKLTFGSVATRCTAVGLKVNIPSCVASLLSAPPAPPPTYEIPSDVTVAVTESQAMEIILGWEKAWLDRIPAKIAGYTHVDVAYIAGRSLEDTIVDASKGAYGFIAVGYALVVVYVAVFFAFGGGKARGGGCGVSGSAPGVATGVASAIVIMVSTFAALGISGLLVSCGVLFTALTLQVVPFLALGLGINDYFVMANYVSAAVAAAAPGAAAADVLAEALKHSGGSITLSSVTNLAAFLLGAITPIPAIRNFSIQVAMTVICNYAVALLVYPSLLYFDIKRHLAGGKDCLVLPVNSNPSQAVADPTTAEKQQASSSSSSDSGGGVAGAILGSVPLRVAVLVLYAGFFCFCAAGIPEVKLGLNLKDVVPDDQYLYPYAEYSAQYFGTYGVYVVTEGVDFESTMEEQRALEYAFATAVPSVDVAEESTNYARYYTDNTEAMLGSGSMCTTEVNLYRDGWNVDVDVCERKKVADPNGYIECAKTCLASKPQTHPDAAVTKRCAFAAVNASYYTCKCPYRAIVKPGNFTEGFPAFLASGLRGSVSAALLTLKEDKKSIASTRSLFYVNDVFDVEDKVTHIKAAREVIKNSALVKEKGAHVFPFDYGLYALNEQYVHIEETTVFALGMSIIAAFFCMMPLIIHPGTCLIVTVLIAMVEVQLYGLLPWIGLKLNAVVTVNLIMSMGIAVEFLSHIARAFMLERGTRAQRAAAAVNTLGSATVNGALTTFLGIMPIALSYYTYFVNYFFLQYVVILAVCLFQGVVVLPVVLSLVGPDAFSSSVPLRGDEKEAKVGGGANET